jgi:hypothetical protein
VVGRPCWLGGTQHVALNMSNTDLAIQLHFALFKGSGGFVLKPPRMGIDDYDGDDGGWQTSDESLGDFYWPPSRELLHRVSIELLSLHNLPKVQNARPDPFRAPSNR